jgi:hypothetical protein
MAVRFLQNVSELCGRANRTNGCRIPVFVRVKRGYKRISVCSARSRPKTSEHLRRRKKIAPTRARVLLVTKSITMSVMKGTSYRNQHTEVRLYLTLSPLFSPSPGQAVQAA